MAIDLAGADIYFADTNHPQNSVWVRFSVELRTAAIAHAKRVWERALGRELTDPDDAADYTEIPRDDLTTYEQALYELQNGIIADGSLSTAKFIAGRTKLDDAREKQEEILSPEAMRWQIAGQEIDGTQTNGLVFLTTSRG